MYSNPPCDACAGVVNKNPKSQQQQPNQQTNNKKNLVNRPSRTIARLDNDNCPNSVMPNGILKKFIANTQTHSHTHIHSHSKTLCKQCALSVWRHFGRLEPANDRFPVFVCDLNSPMPEMRSTSTKQCQR